jgi:hypothetical protein
LCKYKYIFAFFVLPAFIACQAKIPLRMPAEDTPLIENTAEESGAFSTAPYAVIIAGKMPLWFEYAPDAPAPSASGAVLKQPARIEDAALNDFIPWTAARHTTGLLALNAEDFPQTGIAAAVNRFGFVAAYPGKNGEAFLYIFEETGYFPHYTASAPFNLDGYPAVLLFANDFFNKVSSTPQTGAAPPLKRCFAIGKNGLFSREIPAFSTFDPDGIWNIDNFFYGKQGLWYFRARKKTEGKAAVFYGQTGAPGASEKIKEISEASY